jgi:hypothetical protein
MKNLIICLTLAAGFASCSEKPAEKEVIFVPTAPAQTPAQPPVHVIIEKEKTVVEKEKKNGTAVTLDENGFKLDSKDVDIELK